MIPNFSKNLLISEYNHLSIILTKYQAFTTLLKEHLKNMLLKEKRRDYFDDKFVQKVKSIESGDECTNKLKKLLENLPLTIESHWEKS